jgi:beta-N-acetylhexosaminidase
MGRVYVILIFLAFSSCVTDSADAIDTSEEESPETYEYFSQQLAASVPQTLTDRFYNPTLSDKKRVDSIYDAMSINERAAQMIMVSSSSVRNDGSYSQARELVEGGVAGSVLFLKGRKADFAKQAQEFNQLTSARSQSPVLYACDCEPSLLHKKWTDVAPVPPTSSLQDSQAIRTAVRSINTSMREVGVTLNFAPVVDISTNKSIINNRSFGSTLKEVVSGANYFVSYTQQEGIAATVKHFPGHGAVKGDSHKGKVYINGEMSELSNFTNTIEQSRPIAVMVGHIIVRNNSRYSTVGLPASISSVIVTELLKGEIGYRGIVVTDAMNMRAVSSIVGADWKAVEAGVDLVVMPKSAVALNRRIAAYLQRKDAFGLRLETSIKKIILLKVCTGVL